MVPQVQAPVAVCFAPGADPLYAMRMTAVANQLNALRFGADYYVFTEASWSGQGVPRTLTWSLAPDGLAIPGSLGEPTSGSTLFAAMDGAFSSQGGRAAWVARVQQVFDRWHALAGVSYSRIRYNNNDWDDGAVWNSFGEPALRGDIRIGMHSIDGLGGILAYNQYPPSGDMVLDADDVSLLAQPASQHLFLRNCLAHEHGHGLGLMHVCPANQTKLMEPFISTAYDGPRQDDIRGAQFLFGDSAEPNDGFASAYPLGTFTGVLSFGAAPTPPTGQSDPNAAIASIDGLGKSDWYSFVVTGPTNLAVTVTPLGSSYIVAPQNTSGTCPSGAAFDSRIVADLGVEVYSSGGGTVIGSSNTAPAGQPEVLTNIAVPLPGVYYVRVFSATQVSGQSQCYTLAISNPCPSITQQPQGGAVCDGQGVTLMVAAIGVPAPSYQWRKDTLPITGANSGSLSFTPIDPADAGSYDCLVYNSCGLVISDAAVVTVQSANCDGSTAPPRLNANDFQCFLNRFAAGESSANCDGSTSPPTLNANDFQCFLNLFAGGCG